MKQNQHLESREYHIHRVNVGTGNIYTWERIDGLLNTSRSVSSYRQLIKCIKSIKCDAERLEVKPLIIR